MIRKYAAFGNEYTSYKANKMVMNRLKEAVLLIIIGNLAVFSCKKDDLKDQMSFA